MVIEYSKDELIKSGERLTRMFYQGGTMADFELNKWRGIQKGSYVTTDLSYAMWWSVQMSRLNNLYPVTYAFALNIKTDIQLLSHCIDTDVVDGLLLIDKRRFFTI